MLRALSNQQTLFAKYVVPFLFIPLVSAAAAAIFLFGDRIGGPGYELPASVKWLALTGAVLSSALMWWASLKLQFLQMDDRNLYVSNSLIEDAIPLSNVASVHQNRWMKGQPITIEFREPTKFGMEVTFIPKTGWFKFWGTHPVVQEILDAVNAQAVQSA